MEHGRVDAGAEDQAHLEDEHLAGDEVARVADEHRQSARHDQQEAARRPRQQAPRQISHRPVSQQPEQAQVDHRDRADEQRDAGEMHALDEGNQSRTACPKAEASSPASGVTSDFLFHPASDRLQRRGQLGGVGAARLRHVGPAAALAADLLRDEVHQLARLHLAR